MWGATNQSSGAYPMNVAMAEVINKHVPEVSVTVVETGGTNDNFRRMERGEVSFGQSSATDSHTANHGIGIWQGKSMARPRVLVSANPQAFIFVVTEESGIRGLSDLNGQPYCPGLKGSTTELLSYSVFKSLDITPKFMPGSTGEAVDAMKDRRIVGYTKNSTLTSPDSSLQDVATTRKIRLLSFSKEEQQAFLKLYPYYTFVTMPAAVYAQAGDAETLGADFGVAVDKELSADLVYKIAKALCENSEYIGQSYAGVRGVDMAELTARATAWLHPGVIRYLKEKGYALDPAMQYPPEYKD
jgi:TRAP transporter TAXI family solute receptor